MIEYKAADGTKKKIAVKDAKFRSVQTFGTYGMDVPGLTNFTAKNKNNTWYIDGWSASIIPYNPAGPMPDRITNDLIFEQWASVFASDKTAKANCDIWMTYNSTPDTMNFVGVPAVAWCRSQNIGGTPCDLANQYQNMCIWTCGDKLDEMDPTASAYPDLKLGYKTMRDIKDELYQKYNGFVLLGLYSSTRGYWKSIRCVTHSGFCGGTYQSQISTIVPILEIP